MLIFQSFFMTLALLVTLAIYFQKNRRKTLALSASSSFLFGVYNFMFISTCGGVVCFAVMGNTIYQALHSEEDLERTKKTRLAVASATGLFAAFFFFETKAEIYTILSLFVVCYAETLQRQIEIYAMYLLSAILKFMYAAAFPDIFYTTVSGILLMTNMHVCYKYIIQEWDDIALIRKYVPIRQKPIGKQIQVSQD